MTEDINVTLTGGGITDFTDLIDAPSSYNDQADKVISVNSSEDGLEFTSSVSNDNIKYVKLKETIQSVIDSCPVAVGNLKEGFTNSYVIKVAPGHDTEFYSLVRNAADEASDKRNVKVIFEDNPDGKFIVDQYDNCDATTDWQGIEGTVLALDNTHNFEGSNCFKASNDISNVVFRKLLDSNACIDIRKYQGMLVDVEYNPSQFDHIVLTMYDKEDVWSNTSMSIHAVDKIRKTVFLSFNGVKSTCDIANTKQFRFKFERSAGVTGTVTVYVDNFRFVRTTPHKTAIIRFDDSTDEHWSIAAKLLDAKGWKGSFAVTTPYLWGGATRISLQQVLSMNDNGHDIINHSLKHPNFKTTDIVETHFNYKCMQDFLESCGIVRTSKIFINPFHSTNPYLFDILEEAGCVSMSGEHNFYPANFTPVSDPEFVVTSELQSVVDSNVGGIFQIMFHEITNESNFSDLLDWIEEHFSEIILASEVINRLPHEYQPISKKAVSSGYRETLSGNFSLYSWHGQEVSLDPGGAARNVIPVGSNPFGEPMEFRPFHRVEIINTADAAEALTFDPIFTSAGNHDAVTHETIMTDSGENWSVGQLLGRTINNTTDGSSGVITANTATTVTAILSEGTDNQWENADAYTITPVGLNQAVAQNERGIFTYDGEGWVKIFVG